MLLAFCLFSVPLDSDRVLATGTLVFLVHRAPPRGKVSGRDVRAGGFAPAEGRGEGRDSVGSGFES